MSTFLDSARHRMGGLEKVLRNHASPVRPPTPGNPETLETFTKRAAAAFASDMQPVCSALVAALKANDMDALKGLRAMLPHLLAEVNNAPELVDLLAHQLGKTFLDGFTEERKG